MHDRHSVKRLCRSEVTATMGASFFVWTRENNAHIVPDRNADFEVRQRLQRSRARLGGCFILYLSKGFTAEMTFQARFFTKSRGFEVRIRKKTKLGEMARQKQCTFMALPCLNLKCNFSLFHLVKNHMR
jgi:hypothetical protein